ncbi:MAG: DUF4912 domain-containing protein [Candidatus Omnitrophica bacterium]|nr:DUF4912 domain-containing protein [Candidatus Omnitrophota bacterium]
MAKKGIIDIKNGKNSVSPKTTTRTVADIRTRAFLPFKAGDNTRIPVKEKRSDRSPASKIEEINRYAKYIPKKDFVDTYDLPSSYNTTTLTLIPRDPHWIHAYWEVSPPSMEELRSRIDTVAENIIYTLRMYDISCIHFNGNNANHWFDLDFNPNVTNNWYVNLWRDNATYCGEIGARLRDGRFIPMTRSNIVTTPRQTQSRRSEEIWMKVDDDSSGAPFVVAELQSGRKNRSDRSNVSGIRRKVYLTENDIRAYYSRLSPLLRNLLSQRLAKLNMSGYEVVLRDGRIVLDEVLRRGLGKGRFLKRLLLGASEELVLMGGASEFAGASEKSASEREEIKRKFFFEIGTELIVYGRTEPDAAVSLGSKNIPLRSDGTFTLRFALPDGGKIPLDFTARSKNKVDKRRIETGVDRKFTKYE